MSFKLYYAKGACSFVPHCVLEMAGADFEPLAISFQNGEQQAAAFRAINPRGQVPVLIDGDAVITQVMAIISHLDERLPGASILPRPGLARTRVLQTLAWINNTVHPTFTHIFRPGKFASDEAAQAAIKAHNLTVYPTLLGELNALAEQAAPWFSGDNPGPVDAYALALLRWGSLVGIDPARFPAAWAVVQKFAALPAVARVMAREQIELSGYQG